MTISLSTGSPPEIPFQNAVVEQIAVNKVRITGFFLRNNESGTIGFAGDEGATMRLPPQFRPARRRRFAGEVVELADALEVSAHAVDVGGGASGLVITKGGDPFRVTLAAEADTSPLEVYITFHE